MLLLSRLFPKLRVKADKKNVGKGVTSEADILSTGEKSLDYNCKVLLLDDSELALNVKQNAKGQAVLDKVNAHLNLIEKDYFGLRFLDNTSQTHWLDPTKTVWSQLRTSPPHHLYFGVKFYAADPCKLHEEVTRYQFFLQVKRDILQGRLPVSFDVAAELCAYCVQSELGDFDPKRHSPGYVSEFRFTPNQTEDLEVRIAQLHRMLVGQVPAKAEYRFLDKVKWLEMYGVDLHPVQGEGNIEYTLGLTPQGIVVYRNKSKVGNYFWPRLTKITFKAKFFMVRVRDKNNDENTYAFECISKPACKHLWKCCVEHHAFFRLKSASESYKSTGRLFNIGSSKYRYSGRTEKQILAESSKRPPPKVERRPSKRYQRRASSETRLDAAYTEMPDGDLESLVGASVVLPPSHKSSAYQRAEGYQSAPESPRSTRSAPWLNHKGGLYTRGRESPLSVRSEKMLFPKRAASGSESELGPSRGSHGTHRRLESETESEYEPRRHRHRRVPADTESESEANFRHRQRRSRKSTESLPHQEHQWRDVQQRVRDGNVGSVTSVATDPTGGAKRRRNRRSRSPGNRRPPEELAQHFKYVDPETAGISEDQMKEIGYETVVVSGVPAVNIKAAVRSRNKSPRRRSCGELNSNVEKGVVVDITGPEIPAGEAPPPYTDSQRRRKQKQRSQPNLHYPEPQGSRDSRATGNVTLPQENLQQPAVAHRNETHAAPIVKTKSTVYNTPMSSIPVSHLPSPHSPVLPPDELSMKHTRDDSGLGPEQDNGSLNSSSRPDYGYPPRYYYMTAPGSLGAMGGHPPPTHHPGWQLDPSSMCAYGTVPPQYGTLPLEAPLLGSGCVTCAQYPPQYCPCCYCCDRMVSPAGSNTSHSLSHTQGHGGPEGHSHMNGALGGMYMPPAPKPSYSHHGLSEASRPVQHRKSRQPISDAYHYGGYHSNHVYHHPSTSRYSNSNGTTTIRTHSEKMTEL